MDCEKLRIAIAKKTISFFKQFIFLSAGRNRRITQFDFPERREIAKKCEIGENTVFVSRIRNLIS